MQRKAWIEKFCQSGLSRQVFARKHNLKLSTFHRWLAQTKNAPPSASSPIVFKELEPQPVLNIAANNGWAMEIVTPAGLLIRLR